MVYTTTTILIVDDDKAICELVHEGLTEEGYTCDVASTADEAIIKLQKRPFDIALLDIKLPGKSGIELLRTFQTLHQNTEIIMMTAVKDLDIAIQAMKLGASDYFVKPFTIDKLSASIGTILEGRKRYNSVSDIIQPMGNISNGAKIANRQFSVINAIAYGVDTQVDHFDFHSKIVTDKTIDIARRLGLPAKEIKDWAVARHEFYSKRNQYIKSMLNKLERNPIAQVMLGLTHSVHWFQSMASN
jgi:DNA-binding response OmpR family regulator